MELALSLTSQYAADRAILSRPISTLARMRGLRVNDVYERLIPELAKTNETELIRYAEVGLRYATIVDRNRLREEVGPQFITAMDMIIGIVQGGLDSREPWIKRKAMQMHGLLIDEQAEKQRFIDMIMVEQKIEMLAESRKNISSLEQEILGFEEAAQGITTITEIKPFYPPMVI